MKHFELGNNDKDEILRDFAPRAFSSPMTDQREIPALAKDLRLMAEIQKGQRPFGNECIAEKRFSSDNSQFHF